MTRFWSEQVNPLKFLLLLIHIRNFFFVSKTPTEEHNKFSFQMKTNRRRLTLENRTHLCSNVNDNENTSTVNHLFVLDAHPFTDDKSSVAFVQWGANKTRLLHCIADLWYLSQWRSSSIKDRTESIFLLNETNRQNLSFYLNCSSLDQIFFSSLIRFYFRWKRSNRSVRHVHFLYIKVKVFEHR